MTLTYRGINYKSSTAAAESKSLEADGFLR